MAHLGAARPRDEVTVLRAEYVSLLVELGRAREAADLSRRRPR
jgi:hypothetical protein